MEKETEIPSIESATVISSTENEMEIPNMEKEMEVPNMEKEMEIPSMEGRRGKMAREGRRGGNRIGPTGGRTTGNVKAQKPSSVHASLKPFLTDKDDDRHSKRGGGGDRSANYGYDDDDEDGDGDEDDNDAQTGRRRRWSQELPPLGFFLPFLKCDQPRPLSGFQEYWDSLISGTLAAQFVENNKFQALNLPVICLVSAMVISGILILKGR